MTKGWLLALSIPAAMTVSSCTRAEAPAMGWYVGAELGQASFLDQHDTAFKVLGGYQIRRNFAAEAAYGWLYDKNGAEVTAAELVAVGSFPLASQLSILGKVGLANVYIEAPTIDQEKVKLTYGIGIQYDMSGRIGIRGQWQRYETDEAIDLLSIGVLVRF